MSASQHPSLQQLESASKGFDYLFSNDLAGAKTHLAGKDDPFHLLGAGVVAFLEAALGMETGLLAEATRSLTLSEAGSREELRAPKARAHQRFPAGIEFEILNADAVVLLGLTNALSETYMGYLQCMYSLNNAHSKFTKLYKTVFPQGLDSDLTPATTPSPSRKPPKSSLNASFSSQSLPATVSRKSKPTTPTSSFFSRLTGSVSTAASSLPSLPLSGETTVNVGELPPDGPVEEMIVAGTAFGYGLFNLVFSLLPKKIQGLVGFFGYKHDRELALKALAVSAAKKDVHSVFAGLVLMTYHSVVLLLSGYQADEEHTIKQYKAIVDSIEPRYPNGALWALNRAKILRMSSDPESAIQALKEGLRPERPHSFAQADSLLIFELAWTLFGQMKYQESAEMFLKMTEVNSWSHATYYFLAAGCYIYLGNVEGAQRLLDAIPGLVDKRKVGGKDLPTEVFIKKKIEFLKAKQERRGGKEEEYAQAIKISIAEELAIFWNTHARIGRRLALAHIQDWTSLTPALTGPLAEATGGPPNPPCTPMTAMLTTPRTPGPMNTSFPRTPITPSTQLSSTASSLGNPNKVPDLDTPDELALRALLLGINHRTAGNFDASRLFLKDACAHQGNIKTSTWIGGVAMFELAVLELKMVDTKAKGLAGGGARIQIHEAAKMLNEWNGALKSAEKKLDAAGALAGGGSVDLSSRLDSRIEMMRDEIKAKRTHLGI